MATEPTAARKRLATGILANVGVRIAVIAAIVAIAAVVGFLTTAGRDSNGQINKAGDLQASDLKVGDCFDLPGDSSTFDPNATIDKTTAMPCTQAHHYEVFFTGVLTDNGSYPTDADLRAYVDANCSPAFETYVGTPIDQSSLTYYFFYPESAAWTQGDRGIQCSVADPSLKTFSKSLKGSGY